MYDIDLDSTELCLIDSGIESLKSVPLGRQLCVLNLHNNHINRIEHLDTLVNLKHLDFSSNHIQKLEGLDGLRSLKTLNLSCNQIRVVEGLQNLRCLVKINLSFNQIEDVSGFASLWGRDYQLSHIDLHGNKLKNVRPLVEALSGCDHVCCLNLSQGESSNPICQTKDCNSVVWRGLPQLERLDGVSRDGQIVQSSDKLTDIPGLDSYLEYLLSTEAPSLFRSVDTVSSDFVTPKIDEALDKFRKGMTLYSDVSTVTEEGASDRSEAMSRANASAVQARGDNSSRLAVLEGQLAQLLAAKQTNPSSDSMEYGSHSSEANVSRLPAKRDIDHTDDSEAESGSRPQEVKGQRSRSRKKKSVIPSYRKQTQSFKAKVDSASSSTEGPVERRHRSPSASPSRQLLTPRVVNVGTESLAGAIEHTPGHQGAADKHDRDEAHTTYLSLMKELETERERRWKAEEAAKKLAEHIKQLQHKAQNETSLQETSVQVNTRLKQVLMNERETKLRLQDQLEKVANELRTVTSQLETSREADDAQRRALQAMEQTVARAESERLKQQAHEGKKVQESQMKASASNREADILKHSVTTLKGQVQQLQELLANREQEFRQLSWLVMRQAVKYTRLSPFLRQSAHTYKNELKGRYTLESPELQELIQREMSKVEKLHQTQQKILQEKLDDMCKQYKDLEDEFRLALQIEANRFSELQSGFEELSRENSANKQSLISTRSKDEKSSAMLTELTSLVKEQKGRITELSRFKQEQTAEYKERIHTLEAHVEEARKRMLQLELVKKENVSLKAEVEGQVSVVEGLRSERKLWGHELATQGASLAQDRGRLEAQIETLNSELTMAKKQLERECDSVKIKTKMLEDQTETIRKLKQAVVERDEDIKKIREESLTIQRQLEDQLLDEKSTNQELQDSLDDLKSRKDELKQQLSSAQIELEESKKAHGILNKRWKDKSDLIGQLEQQVHQMKDTWEAKEKRLSKERDEAVDRASVAVEKLRSVDDAFRDQLDSKQQQHQDELERLEREKDLEIVRAFQKVTAVEDEMRLLLQETESNKREMEQKVKKLTQAFSDLQTGLT